MIALREAKHAKKVTTAHFQEAMKVVRPSIDADTVKFYEEFEKKFKKGVDRGRREENIIYRRGNPAADVIYPSPSLTGIRCAPDWLGEHGSPWCSPWGLPGSASGLRTS